MDEWELKSVERIDAELIEKGFDVSDYQTLDSISYRHIQEWLELELGLDINKIYRKGRKLTVIQMSAIVRGERHGINSDIYNDEKIPGTIMNDVMYEMLNAKNNKKSKEQIDEIGRRKLEAMLSARSVVKPLDKDQQKEIDAMKALGVDTTEYENSAIKVGILREIRKGYESGIDVSKYYRKGFKLRQWQCKEVRLALEQGIDISDVITKDMQPHVMAGNRLWRKNTSENDKLIAEKVFPLYLKSINKYKEYQSDKSWEQAFDVRDRLFLRLFTSKDVTGNKLIMDENSLLFKMSMSVRGVNSRGHAYSTYGAAIHLFISELLYMLGSGLYMKDDATLKKDMIELRDAVQAIQQTGNDLMLKAHADKNDKVIWAAFNEYSNGAEKEMKKVIDNFYQSKLGRLLKDVYQFFELQADKTEFKMGEDALIEFQNEFLDAKIETFDYYG